MKCQIIYLILLWTFYLGIISSHSKSWALENKKSAQVNYDLKSAIQYALDHSPSFESVRTNLQAKRWEKEAASVYLLPKLDLSSKNGLVSPSLSDTHHNSTSELKVGLTDKLYDNGVGFITHRKAFLNLEKAEIDFIDQRDKLIVEIVGQFIDYSLKLKLLDIQERQLSLVNKEFEMVSKDYYQGIKTKKDYLRFKTYPIRRELDVIRKRLEADDSFNALLKLINLNINPSVYKDKPSTDIFTPVNLEALMDTTITLPLKLEEHLEYKSAELEKEINLLDVEIANKKRFPEIVFDANWNYKTDHYLENQRNFNDNSQFGWETVVTIKYTFFDWGVNQKSYQIERSKKEIANYNLQNKLIELKAKLDQYSSSLGKLRKSYDLAKEWLSLENNNIEYIGREYRNGKVAYLDLISGLNDLAAAQEKFYNVSAELQTTIYYILYHQGLLFKTIFS